MPEQPVKSLSCEEPLDVESLLEALKNECERSVRDAEKPKRRELASQPEQFDSQKGLSALRYIPQGSFPEQAATTNTLSVTGIKAAKALRNRFDGVGYGFFLLVIVVLSWSIVGAHGWAMGIFSCLLMLAVLEISYRLQLHF